MGERRGTKGLELWCRKMSEGYPGVKVENMTTSWRDGLAFCAIIHHFRPDLIEFDKLNKDDVYHNNELAFRVAEHHLGIPALLEPEDMVEYEVPDRLSILTYLSQFYQTFENQRGKTSARIAPKRPQSTPDHGIVSPASTSPPTKVQITIGRAKREPCAKCGLPVFIAERLNVGKLLYHRTCFRCARCNSQLTLANYYETENNEFCCEICPDEEKIISQKRSSEHSVLMRSMSDEEKSASLQTYSEAPDPYSNHFETALEYPVDGELKRNFTLTDVESTQFTKARSHFFNSQIEDSSDSGSEDIPPDLPQSKPPLLANNNSGNVKTDNELVHRDSSFPNDKIDIDVVSDSVSEQTNDHFVTKDNASSNSGISVKARMKLFENNKDKKSDVNNISSSKQVPFDSMQKKKATVVAIDDLEDFDNISKKDIKIKDTPVYTSSNSKKHSDKIRDERDVKQLIFNEKLDRPNDSNIALNENNFTSSLAFTIKSDNVDVETKTEASDIPIAKNEIDVALNQEIQPDVIEILDCSQEGDISVVTVESTDEQIYLKDSSDEQEPTHITIADSPVEPTTDTSISIVTASDESYFSAGNVISPKTNSSPDSVVPKRGYYTAYEVLSPKEDSGMSLENDGISAPMDISNDAETKEDITSDKVKEQLEKDISQLENNSLSDNDGKQVEATNEIILISASQEVNISANTTPFVADKLLIDDKKATSDNINNRTEIDDLMTEQQTPSQYIDIIVPLEEIPPRTEIEDSMTEQETPSQDINIFVPLEEIPPRTEIDDSMTEQETPSQDINIIVPLKEIPPQSEDSIAPRRDETALSPYKKELNEPSQTESSSKKENFKSSVNPELEYPEVLNPFDDDADEESSAVSSSLNPFGEPDDEEIISPKPVPSGRPKKKVMPSLEEREIKGTPEALSRIYIQRISNNPFEDEEDEENLPEPVSRKPLPSPRERKKISLPVNLSSNPFESDEDNDKIVPVPTPRVNKSSSARPEPKPRDTLSIHSKGSHGGSNSSISSGSAVGSARKKKPAPRPPVPFRASEQSAPNSLTVTPSQSVPQSPILSGTIRSRKAKRAPLPPNASTPRINKNEGSDSLPPIEISPVSLQNADVSSIKTTEDRIQREKNDKDEENRNRQSQNVMEEGPSSNEEDSNLPMLNKSTSGRWKRRKGQAPSRPIPQKRTIKTLPISEIKRELDTIEIQQQGLEKQGVRLEQIIREKCEGEEGTNMDDQVPIEVEDLILQLFELVNEKNELFRRQAELMYSRRQQRLEEEHADVEYQIRCLMLQPEANKTDSDKAREEALINRLVEIVERRNEIIECLEMDRVREAEEDNSISSQLNLYSLKRDSEKDQPKEEEKKQKKKKHKKLTKIIHTLHKHKEKEKDHKVDVDKDVDESEVNLSAEKKKKKKFNLF